MFFTLPPRGDILVFGHYSLLDDLIKGLDEIFHA